MKNKILTAMLLALACQASFTEATESVCNLSESTTSICNNHYSFFPLFGHQLGKATASELAEQGKPNEHYDYYLIRGQKLWVQNGIFSHMYRTSPLEVPKQWRNLGFSWYLSYEQITKLFECLGFDVGVTQEPHITIYKGYDSFNAILTATKKAEKLKVVLKFRYGKGTSKQSEGTLHSMRFSGI